jgi:hypothetical protein
MSVAELLTAFKWLMTQNCSDPPRTFYLGYYGIELAHLIALFEEVYLRVLINTICKVLQIAAGLQ